MSEPGIAVCKKRSYSLRFSSITVIGYVRMRGNLTDGGEEKPVGWMEEVWILRARELEINR
jgi:hypothetical protein